MNTHNLVAIIIASLKLIRLQNIESIGCIIDKTIINLKLL
jgi:hypothetical protein